MRVNFIMTNFNNSRYTIQAIESILQIKGDYLANIIVVDNCSTKSEVDKLESYRNKIDSNNLCFLYLKENIGYFRGLNTGLEYLKEKYGSICDYTFVGNNDLVFNSEIYKAIKRNEELIKKYPVVAPNIITLDGIHQNPHLIRRVNKVRKAMYRLYFMNYLFSLGIFFIGRLFFKRKDAKKNEESMIIRQGYGACYLLTQKFFDNFDKLYAPVFLMGEEYFLSEQIYSNDMEILYHPELSVLHYDHVTMGKLYSKKNWLITKDSYIKYKHLI